MRRLLLATVFLLSFESAARLGAPEPRERPIYCAHFASDQLPMGWVLVAGQWACGHVHQSGARRLGKLFLTIRWPGGAIGTEASPDNLINDHHGLRFEFDEYHRSMVTQVTADHSRRTIFQKFSFELGLAFEDDHSRPLTVIRLNPADRRRLLPLPVDEPLRLPRCAARLASWVRAKDQRPRK